MNRNGVLDFLAGTPFLVWYFRVLGSTIGPDCCLYPAGGDPFMPEPDLVTIGKRCVVDCAAIVAHLNTRGNFELVKIHMDDHVTLRARARIQQGVKMENGAMLMEKSLVLTGEEVEANTIWQGAPAVRVFTYDSNSGVAPGTSFEMSNFGGWEFTNMA
jgi:acetyltransferase-like isoleucine patch superfamily enzyme